MSVPRFCFAISVLGLAACAGSEGGEVEAAVLAEATTASMPADPLVDAASAVLEPLRPEESEAEPPATREAIVPPARPARNALRCGFRTSEAEKPPPPPDWEKSSVEDRDRLCRLRVEASELALRGPSEEAAALRAFSSLEDEAAKLLDMAMHQREDPGLAFYYTQQYKEILLESNRFVSSVFTRQFVEEQPWTDILSEGRQGHWQHYGLQNFGIQSGFLEFLGPAKGSRTNGLVAFPAAGDFRDFDLEMEFSVRGAIDVLFRIGRRVDNTVEFRSLSTFGQEPLREDRTYTLRALFVGDTLSCELSPEDAVLPDLKSEWFKSRKGAIGFQVHEEAQVRVTRLRVRVLRGTYGR